MEDEMIQNVKNDRFAQLLGIEILDVKPGYARVQMKIEDKHLNGIDIVQGGVIFTLADYAFAVSSNSGDSTTVGLNAEISYYNAPKGKILIAEAEEECAKKKIAGYNVKVTDDSGELIASFHGLGYRRQK